MDTPSLTEASREAAYFGEVSTLARRYARRLLVLDDADDFAHDIVFECLASLRSGKMPIITTGLAGFVRTMVLRRLINASRANQRRECREAEYARELTEHTHVWMSPDLAVEEGEFEHFLETTLASLPPMCRRVYAMVREDDTSYQAVANVLGVSRAAVCASVVLARRRIRTALLHQRLGSPPVPIGRWLHHATPTNDLATRRAGVPERRDDSAA